MKKVILITNKLFQYRIEVYNFFNEKLKENNIQLLVIANQVQKDIIDKIKFNHKLISYKKYLNEINNYKPDTAVIFLNLSNLIIWPTIHFLKLKKIPFIYWSHGVNLQDPKNKIKNIFFRYIHNISSSILLYTPNQIKYIKKKNHKKIFIANNTLNFNSFPEITKTKNELRTKYNIPYEKALIYISRILPYKRLDILINIFEKFKKDYGLIIIGNGLPNELNERIKKLKNITYLGAIYNKEIVNEYFKLSDIFCIPGANGLSINQAMYWGLPCLTLDVLQGPEVWYIKQGETGFVVKNEVELQEKILYLFENEEELKRMSNNSYNLMRTDGSIEKMFKGFYNAIKYSIYGH